MNKLGSKKMHKHCTWYHLLCFPAILKLERNGTYNNKKSK